MERRGREEGADRGAGGCRAGRGAAGGVRRGRAGGLARGAGSGRMQVSDLRQDCGRPRCGRRRGRKRLSRWSQRGGGPGPLGLGTVEEAKRRQGVERADSVTVNDALERRQGCRGARFCLVPVIGPRFLGAASLLLEHQRGFPSPCSNLDLCCPRC